LKQLLKTDGKKLVNFLLFGVTLLPLIFYIFVISNRASYPFDIEWAEGAALNQVNWILKNGDLYVKPTIQFAPLVYTPLYYYLSAAVLTLLQKSFLAMRLVSILSSFGTAGLIFWLIKRETNEPLIGWISASLYLACFGLSDGFYDLARVDSLYILMLVMGLFVFRLARTRWGYAGAGCLVALAFYSKQSAVIVFFPLICYVLVMNWKKAWPILLTVGVGIALPYYLFNKGAGWFSYYIYNLPAEHGYSLLSAVNFWVGDILKPLAIAIGFIMFYGLSRTIQRKAEQPDCPQKATNPSVRNSDWESNLSRSSGDSMYILFAIGAIGSAWITRSTNGGGSNNGMSAYLAIAILFGLGFNYARLLVYNENRADQRFQLTISGLVLIQFLILTYNPFSYIPTNTDREINQKLLNEISAAPGQVLIPYRSHLPELVRKNPQIHMINLFEFTGYFNHIVTPEGRELVEQIRANICSQQYSLIILDQPVPWLEEQIMHAYSRKDNSHFAVSGFQSKATEWQQGFDFRFEPKEDYDYAACLETVSITN